MTEQLPFQELIDFIGLHQSTEEINFLPRLITNLIQRIQYYT